MLSFLLAFTVVLVSLYAPGYLIGRSLSLSRTAALAFAPAIDIAIYVAAGVALFEVGISCPALTLPAIALVVALLCIVVARIARRAKASGLTQHTELSRFDSSRFLWKAIALYIGIGVVVSAAVFLSGIDGVDSFARKDDTTTHLNIVRAFLDTGTYSTLNTWCIPELGVAASGYYPAGWHIIVTIAASCIGNSVTIATNASTFAFTAVVLPLSIFLLLSNALPGKRNIILAGAVFTVTFQLLPWGYLTKGQLLSNMAAISLVPAVIALFIAMIETPGTSARIKLGALTAVGLVSIALCQPNGAFTCVIGIASYAVCRIFRGPGDERATFTAKRVALAIGMIVVACALWVVLFFAPPLQGVVTYGQWDTLLSLPQALAAGLSFMYVEWGGVQPLHSVIVLLGAIAAFRDRRYIWFVVGYLVTFIIYMANMTLEGVPRQFLAGFWYADYYRTGAMNALFAVPLAALGLAWLIKLIGSALSRISMLKSNAAARNGVAIGMFAIVFIVCNTIPFSFAVQKFDIENGLVTQHTQIRNLYTWNTSFTGEERAFLQKANTMLDQDRLVVNVPNDGTAWAYGTDGFHTLFRRTGDNGSNTFPSATNKLIREHLDEIATNPDVQQAVRNVNAKYVILLDDKSSDNPTLETLRYKEEKWAGIESIDESTPGFKLLLSEGDMRLYEITAVE